MDKPLSKIRARREEMGISLESLAKAAICSPKGLELMERNRFNPKPQLLERLAEALSCRTEDLLEEEKPPIFPRAARKPEKKPKEAERRPEPMITTTVVTTTTCEESRGESMARMYGEVCNKSQAARILNCSTAKITDMLGDGRLLPACQGEKVDVRSIAAYIESPEERDYEARRRKEMAKNNCKWAV